MRSGRHQSSKAESGRPNIYDILHKNLDKPVYPDDSKSLTVKQQLAKNQQTRLFDNLGDILNPVFDECYRADSISLLEIIHQIRTQGATKDFALEDDYSAADIRDWCKTIMSRASNDLFMNTNNAISPNKKRNILGKTSSDLSSTELLVAYFGAFMQHLLVRVNQEKLISDSTQDQFQAFIAFISESRERTESNITRWANEVLAERRDPSLIRHRQPVARRPQEQQKQEHEGLSGTEIATMVLTGVGLFTVAVIGGLVAANVKKPERRPCNNNHNNNKSPDVSPDWADPRFRKM